MLDMTQTVKAKSDQLNAIDLIGGPLTIKVKSVVLVDSPQQPTHIEYEGAEGRPYKPSLGFRRALIKVWGDDGHQYVGKSLTVYRDPTVTWAGKEDGGIRISHMSDIVGPDGLPMDKIKVPLRINRNKIILHEIKLLTVFTGNPLSPATLELLTTEIEKAGTMAELQAIAARIKQSQYDNAGTVSLRSIYDKAVDRVRGGK